MAGKNSEPGQPRLLPRLALPITLTLALTGAAFLFVSKVTGDQERADAEAYRLESYARGEAGRLAKAAGEAVREFVETRNSARRTQEGNLRLEARSILNSAYQLLAIGLEKAARGSLNRREVGPLPQGFDGMRPFLEIPPPGERRDASLAALRAMTPELSELLPAGCALAVIEDNSRELLSLGGAPAEGSLSVSLVREFLFNDAGGGRRWTLKLELSTPDAHPEADPPQLAERLTAGLADATLSDATWRGWLLGPGDGVAAAFPASTINSPNLPPFVGKFGEWILADDRRLVWMEKGPAVPGTGLAPAVAVAIARPQPPLILADEFWRDRQWSIALMGLAALAAGSWLWFARWLAAARRAAAARPAKPRAETRIEPGRRLVRESASRVIPEVQGVIVAEIDDAGSVHVETPGGARPAPRPKTMPTGSLSRLQAVHRGRAGMSGSRILDQARSPVLRELAKRVRPAVDSAHTAASAKAADTIAAMKSANGWPKVDDKGAPPQ